MIDKWIKKGLALLIILLYIFMSINPSSAVDNVKKSSTSVSDGNILYVGGSGEGNYTKIQDAIDYASDGDTVFVYDDSSPYYENISINKSISLFGEEKNTTIIDSNGKGSSIRIIDDLSPVIGVTINGFTIRGAKKDGINVYGIFCIIENNIISSNSSGVRIWGDYSRDNIIKNNNIFNSNIGISVEMTSKNNNIFYNFISNNSGGIYIWLSDYNNISYNQISNNKGYGIKIYDSLKRSNGYSNLIDKKSYHNNITSNNISFNGVGIIIYPARNFISKNNFIFNDKNAYFEIGTWVEITGNIWNGNYWNKTRFLPYIIFGKIGLFYMHPWVNFDWHPAKEPYNIPSGM